MLAYSRVSTAEQATSGLGLDSQERAVGEHVARKRWELVDVVRDEGASGKDLERPGLRRALERIARGEAEGLVVSKLDRLSRSVVDSGHLLEWFDFAGATLVALDLSVDTSTPQGKLVANVLAAVAEWERDTIAARTKAGLAEVRAQGRPVSRASTADRPDLAERIRTMKAAGETLHEICAQLNAEAIPTSRTGVEWRRRASRPCSATSVAGRAGASPTFRQCAHIRATGPNLNCPRVPPTRGESIAP